MASKTETFGQCYLISTKYFHSPNAMRETGRDPFIKATSTLYRIAHSACTKNISDRAFVHTQNHDIRSIFVPERCCAASVLKLNRHISNRFSRHFLEYCEQRIEPEWKSTTRSEDWILVERWRRFWATSVHTRPEYFSQRYKMLSSIV